MSKGRLPLIPYGFTRSLTERCPDCEYRGALDNIGKARIVRGRRLSWGCETCGGKGRIPLPRERKIDPYWTGKF